MSGTVVLLGKLPVEKESLEPLAKKFGWSVQVAETLSRVQCLGESNIVGILFNPKELHKDWRHALKMVAHAFPDALPIICCRFSEGIHWPDGTGTGPFHLLHYPFAMDEVRQSFGFAREAQRRRRSLPAHRALALEAASIAPSVPARAVSESQDDVSREPRAAEIVHSSA